MDDLISRAAALEALEEPCKVSDTWTDEYAVGERMQWEKDVKALNSLPFAQPERQWIPCSKRLPRQGQEVICQCIANMIKVLKLDACGDWYQDAEHCYMSGFVIAWMPLPEPYREENK